MRRWILNIVLVTFTWGQIAQAYPQNDVPALKNFLQKSGWTKGDVKLKDIYELTKEDLPLDFRFEVERMLEQNPNLKLPKLEVRMIKNGRFEDVQLIAQKGRESAIATLSYRGDNMGEISYAMGGKNIKKKLTYADVYNPVKMVAEAYGPGVGIADRIQFTRFLHKDELALLRPQDRQNYSEMVRDALRVAEKAQQTMNEKRPAPKKSKSPSKTSLLINELIDQAHAANGDPAPPANGPCLVLGWIGVWKNGQCEAPAEAKDPVKCPGTITCSKILYGANAECGKTKIEEGEANSTAEICNKRNADNKYDFFSGIKSQAEFDKKMKELSLKINEIRLQCEKVGSHVADCRDLEVRMAELMKVNCNILHKWKEQFTDLKCQAPAKVVKAEEPKAVPPAGSLGKPVPGADLALPVPDKKPAQSGGRDNGDEEGTPSDDKYSPAAPARPAENLNEGVRCEGLPLSASALDCAGGSTATITCNSLNEVRTHYYCVCGGGLRDKYSKSAKPIGCERDKPADYARDRDYSWRRPTRERKEMSWWESNGGFQGMLGGILTIGVGFLAYRAQQNYQQQQWGQFYNMYQPQVLRIAPPPTSPVILNPTNPLNPTVPVLPGTR